MFPSVNVAYGHSPSIYMYWISVFTSYSYCFTWYYQTLSSYI